MGESFLLKDTFDHFNQETQVIFPFLEDLLLDEAPLIPKMTNMYPSDRRSKTMYSTVPGSSDHSDTLEPQSMGGLSCVATNAASNSYLSILRPWNLDIQPDQRAFLAAESYPSTRRESLATTSSHIAWSTASNAEVLSNSPHLSSFDASVGSEVNTPFMQSYDPSGSLQPTMNSSRLSGFTSQQIDQWCSESDPGDFYQSPPFQSMGMIPTEPFNAFNITNEQWLPVPDQHPTSFSAPVSETFLSIPRSNPSQNTSLFPSTTTSASVPSTPPHAFSDPDSPPPPSSASNTSDLSNYGIPTGEGTWRCAHPGCSSQSTFRRGCDLRKHFNRHQKYLFCRHEGCPQSVPRGPQSARSGFSSKKDRARHEARHNPGVLCEWEGCGRVFSRVDNMKDHVRRIHRRAGAGRG